MKNLNKTTIAVLFSLMLVNLTSQANDRNMEYIVAEIVTEVVKPLIDELTSIKEQHESIIKEILKHMQVSIEVHKKQANVHKELSSINKIQTNHNNIQTNINKTQTTINEQLSNNLQRIAVLEKHIIELEEKVNHNSQFLPTWMLNLQNNLVEWNNKTFSLPKDDKFSNQ